MRISSCESRRVAFAVATWALDFKSCVEALEAKVDVLVLAPPVSDELPAEKGQDVVSPLASACVKIADKIALAIEKDGFNSMRVDAFKDHFELVGCHQIGQISLSN